MRRKTAKVNLVKLSPNEEAHLAREELERRRKLRLQQVREQERYIASQVRREVRERREKELQNLASTLQGEWHEQREDRIQTLEKIYQDSLHAVGQGHRSAKENEPDWEALARRSEEQQERAAQRHRDALRELSSRRHIEDEQRNWHVRARKKALEAEKERAAKVASLPPPPPDPAECIVGKAPLTLRKPDVEHFSVTHYSMPETAVDRETHTDLPNARQAAEVEAQRLEELEKEEMCDRQGQLEKARLRGNHALKREQQTQDHARWLAELGQLQQADLLRRRQVINTMPAQIFQPLYRRELLREDQQRELEIAFQDLYTGERKVKGDLVLQLVPEPLPALSTDSQDEDLDVTLEPQAPPESEGEPVAPVAPLQVAASRPVGGTGRPALRKLLDRIRTQRDQWIQRDPTAVTTTAESEAVEMVEGMSIETGSLSGEERGPHPVTKQQAPCTPSPTHERSEESIVAGTILPPEERRDEIMAAGTERSEREEALLTQQQEQLALLEELEEKRRSLECRLQEAQQERERLQQAAQVHAETQGPSAPPQEALLGPAHKAGEPEDPHTQRLRQYQQRLLDQNRLHKKCVEDARHRLEEYQRTLKTRHAAVTLATLQPPSLPPPQHPPVTMGTLHPHASLPVPLCPPDVPPQLSDAFDPSAGARGPVEVSLRGPPKPPCPTPQPLHPEPALPLPAQSLQPPPSQSPQPPAVLSLPPKPPPPVPSPTLHSGPETEAPSDRISSSEPVPITLPPERGELPLPPPSVVLELLLSRRGQDQVLSGLPHIPPFEPQVRQPPVGRTPSVSPTSTQASVEPGALLDGEPQQELPSWATGAERDQEVRQQMRRQRDALQALLTTSSTRSSEVGSEVKQPEKLSLMDTLLRAIEASSELLPPSSAANQRISSIPAPLPQSNGSSMAAPVSRGRVKPPVSRPPARTPLLQEMEPHELSAIQEVDTPANISLSAEFQTPSEPRVDRSENSGSGHSESSSMSLPSLEQLTSSSGVSSKPNGEVKRSESSIGRTSRLSWRDMLRMESEASQPESGSKYPNQQPSDELEVDFPSGRRPMDPDCLSSTTISTGSYSTSEHDVNYTVGDSSCLVVESGGRGMASFAGSSPQLSSSSVIGLRSPGATDLALLDSSVQSIIARYTKELDASLRTAGTHTDVSEDVRGGGQGRTSVLQQQDAEQEVPASDSGRSSGKLTRLQDFSTLTQRHSSPTSTHPAEDYGRSADLRISINPADDNSSFETSGHFQPLQPHPDLDSTSSSSSHHSERREQSRRPQERDETIERIIGHLSDQLLSVGRDSTLRQLIGQPSDQSSSLDLEQDRDSNLSRLISQLSRHSSQTSLSGTAAWASASSVSQLIGQLTDQSNSLGADKSSEPNTSQPIGQITDHSVSHCLTEGQDSDMSQMIGLAADLQSSQVLDESRAVTHGPVETTDMQHIQSSVAASDSSRCSEDVGGEGQSALTSSEERAAKVGSPSASTPPGPDPLTFSPQLPLEEGRSEHDDLASGVFHALHPEITHNETAECSMTFHLPPEPRLCSQVEAVHTQEAAESSSDWLESTDSSHPTFGSESSPDRLRTEVSGQSQNPLQLTLERLSILHNSPHDSVQVVSPTRDEPSLAPQPLTSSTHQQDVNPDPVPELPPQESKMDVGAKNQSVSGEKVVLPPWERIMDLGSEKGILDESAISLVSLTETTLQEQDGTLTEGEEGERGKEASGRTQKEGEDDLHGGPKAADDQNLRCQSVMELTSKQSEVEQPALSHAVMLLEFQSSPAVPLQEAFLRRRRDLAQRSVHRVEQLKARWAESRAQSDGTKRMEPKFGQILEPCPDLPGKGSVQKPGTGGASRLKRVGEVKIVTPEQRHLGETEMYQRTERLYSQLEEVKRRKEFLSRQESYAKNREKAKEFQRKTLQKLRGKQTRR